jgi:hypothetical protein
LLDIHKKNRLHQKRYLILNNRLIYELANTYQQLTSGSGSNKIKEKGDEKLVTSC